MRKNANSLGNCATIDGTPPSLYHLPKGCPFAGRCSLAEKRCTVELPYLFTAHDLSMVYHISDRIGVMYLGAMVETGTSEEVFYAPLHPYTKALISAVPIADPQIAAKAKHTLIKGEIPSPMNIPKGCRFCARCPQAEEKCRMENPEMREVAPGHMAACHCL